jgi:DNA polymerase III alpha subunit
MIKADQNTGIEILYRNRTLHDIAFDSDVVDMYNSVAQELDLHVISDNQEVNKHFNIPQYYQELDVEDYVVKLIPHTEDQTDKLVYLKRVEEELALYKARNLYPVLQLMIYIVDTMRKHDVVWGVGRGSSVASYVLYLIGVHKIDSIRYDLNIREFLK